MLTQPIAIACFQRMARIPSTYLRDNDARKLLAKTVRFIRKREGSSEARMFMQLMRVSEGI
jgi:hypothetical protein